MKETTEIIVKDLEVGFFFFFLFLQTTEIILLLFPWDSQF